MIDIAPVVVLSEQTEFEAEAKEYVNVLPPSESRAINEGKVSMIPTESAGLLCQLKVRDAFAEVCPASVIDQPNFPGPDELRFDAAVDPAAL